MKKRIITVSLILLLSSGLVYAQWGGSGRWGEIVGFLKKVTTSIIPSKDDIFSLGSSSQEWKDLYIDGTAYLDAIDYNGTDISSVFLKLDASNDPIIGNLELNGILKSGDGGTIDYLQISDTGVVSLHGTARVKREIILANATLEKGNIAPTQKIDGNFLSYEYDPNDDSVLTWEVPNDWDSTTDMLVRVCWYIDEAYVTNNGEVRFQLDWSMVPHDNSEAVDNPTHFGSDDTGDLNIPATAKFLAISDMEIIPATSIAEGDEIGFTFSRINIIDGSSPAAHPRVIHLEIEYIKNSLGEAL